MTYHDDATTPTNAPTTPVAPANPFLALIPTGRPAETAHDPTLPPCPCCAAPARAGYAYTAYDDLTHDCDCDLNDTQAYYVGLRRAWAARRRMPELLRSLPEMFHGAKPADFLGNATALALTSMTASRYIYGERGVGKSHLGAAAALSATRRGEVARYWPLARLLDAMRDAVKRGDPRPDILSPDLLIVDDLSYAKPTDFSFEVLFGLADARWASKKATLYLANHDADTTALLHTPATLFSDPVDRRAAAAALASRFTAGGVTHLTGHDRRSKAPQ